MIQSLQIENDALLQVVDACIDELGAFDTPSVREQE